MVKWTLEFESFVLERLAEGGSAVQVAQELKVSTKTMAQYVKLNSLSLVPGRNGGLGPAVMPSDAGQDRSVLAGPNSHGHRLDTFDRSLIQVGLDQGWSMAKIAAKIGVHPTTVSREIKRSAGPDEQYWARRAQARADIARARPKCSKLEPGELRDAVVERLNTKFSPMQVSQDLRKAFPTRDDMRVSHETIYQALYVQGKGSLRQELKVEKALRSGRTSRIPRSDLPPHSGRPWLEGHHISTRPAEVADRAVPGHWEGDLVIGKDHKSALITLAERASRFTLIRRLPFGHDSQTVVEAVLEMIQTLPNALLQTLTWDQGSEMARHTKLTLARDMQVFFCDPHSPWQRGTNENTNGLIRDFYPKGTDFRDISDADIQTTQDLLNIRPRQTLDWDTPAERLNQFIANTALTA